MHIWQPIRIQYSDRPWYNIIFQLQFSYIKYYSFWCFKFYSYTMFLINLQWFNIELREDWPPQRWCCRVCVWRVCWGRVDWGCEEQDWAHNWRGCRWPPQTQSGGYPGGNAHWRQHAGPRAPPPEWDTGSELSCSLCTAPPPDQEQDTRKPTVLQ